MQANGKDGVCLAELRSIAIQHINSTSINWMIIVMHIALILLIDACVCGFVLT
jgi:hypothetical protein